MNKNITWETKRILIRDLKEYEHNPRRISKKDFERLVNDIKQDGYRCRITVDSNNTIIGGHSRKKALLAAGLSESDSIEVLAPSRKLTEEEFKRINIRDNLPFGEFDFDMLANDFDTDKLLEWGMPVDWLPTPESVLSEESLKPKEVDYELCTKCPYKEAT